MRECDSRGFLGVAVRAGTPARRLRRLPRARQGDLNQGHRRRRHQSGVIGYPRKDIYSPVFNRPSEPPAPRYVMVIPIFGFAHAMRDVWPICEPARSASGLLFSDIAAADEVGSSFWLPGTLQQLRRHASRNRDGQTKYVLPRDGGGERRPTLCARRRDPHRRTSSVRPTAAIWATSRVIKIFSREPDRACHCSGYLFCAYQLLVECASC